MFSRRSALKLASLVLANRAAAEHEAAPAPAPHQVVIELSDYPLVFTQVRVNGHEVRALLDTGSSTAVRISANLARQLDLVLAPDPGNTVQGLDGRRFALQRARLDTFVLGGLEHRAMDAEVAGDRVESIAAQVGTRFDVLLGWGFLARRSFVLDYPKRVLHFTDGSWPISAKGLAIAYAVRNRVPVVTARVGDTEVALLVDTGAPMCNLDAKFAQAPLGQIVIRELRLGAAVFPVAWRAKDLSVIVTALGTLGTLGNNFLGQYAMYFDTRSRTVHFER